MPSLTVSPETIPPGGSALAVVGGLSEGQSIQRQIMLVRRADGQHVQMATVTLELPGETVGLEEDIWTDYFLTIEGEEFVLEKTPSPNTFAVKHVG